MTKTKVATVEPESVDLNEDRILRVWTPVLLRTIVLLAMTSLIAGLILTVLFSPNHFVERYHEVQLGHLGGRESLATLATQVLAGEPRAILLLGLFLLTLVPLVRVAFCLGLYIKSRDYAFIGFTAYVLAALIVGAMLGRIG